MFEILIFDKLYDFYKNLSWFINRFPKVKRYTLGQKLDNLTLEIFELLFSIPNSQDKAKILNSASIKLDLVKLLIRFAKDTQCLKDKNYLELQVILQEIGKMLGGWIRAAKQNLPD